MVNFDFRGYWLNTIEKITTCNNISKTSKDTTYKMYRN